MARSRLRSPFVITATIASAMVACGPSSTTLNPPGIPADSSLGDGEASAPDVAPDVIVADVTPDVSAEVIVDAQPAACPHDDPGIGARKPCDAPESVRCSYDDLCPSRPKSTDRNVYVCHDDGTGAHWALVSLAYTPDCPTVAPHDGDPCPCTIHMAYIACNYGLCEDMTRTYAACKGVDTFDPVWHVSTIACNPPEPDAATDGADARDGD